MIRVMRGIQWGKSKIRVLEGGRVYKKKKILKNDRYDCDKGEDINPMKEVSNNGAKRIQTHFFFLFFFFTPVELYSDLKNITLMKCPNA
jgi:hypothetical protein